MSIDRRALILGALAAPLAARAEEGPITVLWEDLVPKDGETGEFYDTLREMGLIQLSEKINPFAYQPPSAMVRDYDDKIVRIPGFVIPMVFEGTGVTEGLLVPYVGACIHVPPPPANQIVFIKLKEAQDEAGLWDPVWATGLFATQAIETELAEIGYLMSDVELAPYQF